MRGYLLKKKAAETAWQRKMQSLKWQRRYFVLSEADKMFYFYATEADAEVLIYNKCIPFDTLKEVRPYSESKHEGTRFDLVTCDKTFAFKAESVHLANEWVSALQRSIPGHENDMPMRNIASKSDATLLEKNTSFRVDAFDHFKSPKHSKSGGRHKHHARSAPMLGSDPDQLTEEKWRVRQIQETDQQLRASSRARITCMFHLRNGYCNTAVVHTKAGLAVLSFFPESYRVYLAEQSPVAKNSNKWTTVAQNPFITSTVVPSTASLLRLYTFPKEYRSARLFSRGKNFPGKSTVSATDEDHR